jgi:hypothetical protein
MDAAAPGLLLAQAIGRWGNWFNQELFGAPTTLPWGLEIDPANANFPAGTPADTLFHPTFLYESLWNLAGVGILLLLDRRFKFRLGRLFWLYAMYYTLGRVWIEALRIDDAELVTLLGVTTRLNVWTSVFVFLAATAVFIILGRRGRPEPDSPYLPGKEPREVSEAAADSPSGYTADDVTVSDAEKPEEEAPAPGELPKAEVEDRPTEVHNVASERPEGAAPRRRDLRNDAAKNPAPAVSEGASHGNLQDSQSDPGHAPSESGGTK